MTNPAAVPANIEMQCHVTCNCLSCWDDTNRVGSTNQITINHLFALDWILLSADFTQEMCQKHVATGKRLKHKNASCDGKQIALDQCNIRSTTVKIILQYYLCLPRQGLSTCQFFHLEFEQRYCTKPKFRWNFSRVFSVGMKRDKLSNDFSSPYLVQHKKIEEVNL